MSFTIVHFFEFLQVIVGQYKKPEPFNADSLSDCKLWLDAADESTITLNGTTVSEWADKSSESNLAVQGTAAKQPSYTSSTIGGLPALAFDGTQSSMATDIQVDIADGPDAMVFMIYQSDFTGLSTFDERTVLEYSPNVTSADAAFMIGYQKIPVSITNGYISIIKGNVGANTYGTQGYVTTPQLIRVDYSYGLAAADESKSYRNQSILTIDGGSVLNNNTDSAFGLHYLFLGARNNASQFFDGSIGEIIIYNRLLESYEVQEVESYLRNKWNV